MYQLKQTFKKKQEELVRIILEAAPAHKIYLLGSTIMERHTQSVFVATGFSCHYPGHYYILVLVNGSHDLNAIQDKIESNCRYAIPATAIVLYSKEFNNRLKNGHPFATAVTKMAVLLHGTDDDKNDLSTLPVTCLQKAANESMYNKGANMVKELLAGSAIYSLGEQNKLAVFMLNKTADVALHTILKITTGMYMHTHNIDKLVRYCNMVSYRMPEIFPRNNEKNERLFQILNKANIHTGYKDDYVITIADVDTIGERIMMLQREMRAVCKAALKNNNV